MLSIKGSISAGSADSYYQKDDYYLKEGGKWQGRAAQALGVKGEIDKDEFVSALQGKDMAGNQLIAKTEGVFDPDHKQFGKDRAAIDLTFSAPKSVSILGFSDPTIKEAHDIAVSKTLERVEALSGQTREQTGGKREIVHTGNLCIAKFDHSVSRSLDPQLHTHCVIMNMTQKENGDWRALETMAFFKNKMDYGLLYRNELAHELTRRGIAIEVTDRQQGFFEIKDVDQGIIEYFSKRSEEIDQRVEELRKSGDYPNADDARLKEIAALGSRSAKPEAMKKEDIKNIVKQGIESRGYEYATYYDAVKKKWPEHRPEKRSLTETLDNALRLSTDSEAVFKESKILKETARLSLGNFSQTEIQQSFKEKADVIALGRGDDGVMYYTTKAMQVMEKEVVKRVNAAKGQYMPQVTDNEVRKHLDRYEQKHQFAFTQGQRDAALTVLNSPDRVNVIQGDAGTGKTAYLRQVKQIVEDNNGQVFGLGFTGKAAAEIRAVGIESMTIDSFLNREVEIVGPGEKATTDNALSIQQGAILIMDEASMTGIRHFDKILKFAEKENLKLVIQGDNKQLPSLSAGRMHDILYQQAEVAKVNLNEIVRQRAPVMDKDGKEKESGSNAYYTVQAMQKQGIGTALNTMEAQGNIIEIADREQRLEAIKEAAITSRQSGSTLVLTDLNKDRIELNRIIRNELIAIGKLPGKGYSFNIRSSANLQPEAAASANAYRKGQDLFVRKQIPGMDRGSQWEIVRTSNNNNTITVKNSDMSQTLDISRYGNHVSAFNAVLQDFVENDHIIFLKNDNKLGVSNGELATIKEIDKDGSVSAVIGKGDDSREVHFNLDKSGKHRLSYNYIDQAYAITLYKSQGATDHNAILHHDSTTGMTSSNSLMVGLTRATENVQVFTDKLKPLAQDDNSPNLTEQAKQWDIKTSTLDSYAPDKELVKEDDYFINFNKLREEALDEIRNPQEPTPEIEKQAEKEQDLEKEPAKEQEPAKEPEVVQESERELEREISR